MSQMSMFPDEFPDEEPARPERLVSDGTTVLRLTHPWVLVRSGGRRLGDHPTWHKARAQGPEGGVICVCGAVGSVVVHDLPQGTSIAACVDCLGPSRV